MRNFYKYQIIKDRKNPESDSRIKGLFKCHAIFSSRINFNDPLDSKIKFVKPSVSELVQLSSELNGEAKIKFESYVKNERLTSNGESFIKKYEEHLNSLFDEEYFFFCVSSKGTSNLMWSHYANSHHGFCIEFKNIAKDIDKVIYTNGVASLNMIDCIRLDIKSSGFDIKVNMGDDDLWNAVRTKYDEWSYESEYRLHACEDMMSHVIERKKEYLRIQYNPDLVESVIFGHRMNENIKKYIIDNIPYPVKFKQSILTDDGFENIDYVVK